MTVSVRAQASGQEGPSTGPVGFDLTGRFDMDAGTSLPILDMIYTRHLGDAESVVGIMSDGATMVVTADDGLPVEVPPDEVARLGLGEGDRPAGLDELGIAGWITDAEETAGPVFDGVATRRLAGPVDAADLVSDIAVLGEQVSGQGQTGALDDAAASRLQDKVRAGDVEVLVDDENLPRRVRATADFGASVPPELQQALGPYAGARLEVLLELRSPGTAVTPPSLP